MTKPASLEAQTFRLMPLSLCSAAQIERVREIRNQPSVRASMFTQHEISADEHRSWVRRVAGDKLQQIFVVTDAGGSPVGQVGASRIDRGNRRCDWAFYLDDASRGGLGAALELHFIDYVFDALQMEKLNCEVLETNDAVVRLHEKFGFVREGFRRAEIRHSDSRSGVHCLGLLKDEWHLSRARIVDRHRATLSRFIIEFASCHQPPNASDIPTSAEIA